LHFCYAADDEIADFGGVARAEGQDGEEFVGFVDGAGDGGEDCGGLGGGVGAVASVWEWVSLLGFRMLSHRRVIETGGLVGVREGEGADVPHPLRVVCDGFAGCDNGFLR